MSKAVICDVCKTPIESGTEIPMKIGERQIVDLCDTCFSSPVILSEMRRTRTRKARKPGRPKGKAKSTTPSYSPDILEGTL